MSKQPGLAHAPVLQTSSGFASQDPVENHPFFQDSLYSCSHLLTKISPLLSFLIPQITHYSHLLCFFGQAWLWFDARLLSEVMQMEGISQCSFVTARHLSRTRGVCRELGEEIIFISCCPFLLLLLLLLFYFFSVEQVPWSGSQHGPVKRWSWENWGVVQYCMRTKKVEQVVGMFLRPQDQKTVAFLLPPWDESSPNF